MPAPQWRTVLTWMAAVIDTHSKVSFNRKNVNGQIPSKGVYSVLKDMAKAADAAKELQEENKKLIKRIHDLENQKGTLKEVDDRMIFASELDKKYRINDDGYLGWYAKNKVGNLFQFQWQENDDFHILKSDGRYHEVDKSDYEIIKIKMITEKG